ncbi:two component transcriptional regulator, winged helix family [Desulfovibrio sp. X2]|uniref:response regulator transcription factor n=1 Tax=Desulfovibrio sp. X2 TaxID=941449 RepID=UPI0003587968|nr:response regulator transcription factor [Desulfovibrio sp. X2]EPR43092.1 two component transcriptional regulator, winged helix family [Desulfovibrio sp. X2]
MRILLVDDDAEILRFLKSGLEQEGHEVDLAESGTAGLARICEQAHDLVVLDLMFGDLDGFTILREIREKGIKVPVIVVSARQAVDDRIFCLNSGCDDYLTKPFSFLELLARIKAITRRRTDENMAPARLSLHGVEVDLLNRRVFRDEREIHLKPKEFLLLKYLMENAGDTVSRPMIMKNVWGYEFDPGTKVLDVHVSQLRDKLDSGHDGKLIHTVRGCGYVFKQD